MVAAILFFGSIVLHELGHALAARRSGIEVAGIDLFFFGGVMKMSRDTDTPGKEFFVAVAGPLVTLAIVLAGTAAGVAIAGWTDFYEAARLGGNSPSDAALLLVSFLVTMNAFLLVFNLVPAFPLDGGRIARAAIWKTTGDRAKATRLSGLVGQGVRRAADGLRRLPGPQRQRGRRHLADRARLPAVAVGPRRRAAVGRDLAPGRRDRRRHHGRRPGDRPRRPAGPARL